MNNMFIKFYVHKLKFIIFFFTVFEDMFVYT